MTSLTDKPLIWQWELWLRSLLGLKGLTYQRNSCWVIISFVLTTSEKALILQREIWSLLEHKGLRHDVPFDLSNVKNSGWNISKLEKLKNGDLRNSSPLCSYSHPLKTIETWMRSTVQSRKITVNIYHTGITLSRAFSCPSQKQKKRVLGTRLDSKESM